MQNMTRLLPPITTLCSKTKCRW